MRTSILAFAALAALPAALAQTLAPSPSESVGCEPHGDHWHCDGPRETTTDVGQLTSETLAPSPTESVGCEPHGDHWHCDGSRTTPVSTTVVPTTSAVEEDHEHEHDEDAEHTESLSPSPTESVGCEPHGDHWHCDGPATTGAANSTRATTTMTPSSTPTGGAAVTAVPVVGMLALAMLAF